MTWRDYESDLEQKLSDLHEKIHMGAYRAQPSRRRYIPKADGKQRPLAVAALEDKIVQRATAAVLNQIYEEDFLGFSYGFRPRRGQHDALDALMTGIGGSKVRWIIDADIQGFFDAVNQEWLIRFLEHRIGDRRIIRLIQKWLKAGILEDGTVKISDRGTGQGSVISPLLANVYLHYVFDLWAEQWRRREVRGDMIVTRYADDIVIGFEHENDARRFLELMRARFERFSLTLHPEKTPVLCSNRHHRLTGIVISPRVFVLCSLWRGFRVPAFPPVGGGAVAQHRQSHADVRPRRRECFRAPALANNRRQAGVSGLRLHDLPRLSSRSLSALAMQGVRLRFLGDFGYAVRLA